MEQWQIAFHSVLSQSLFVYGVAQNIILYQIKEQHNNTSTTDSFFIISSAMMR